LEGEKVNWSTISTYSFIKVNNSASKTEDKPREIILTRSKDIDSVKNWIVLSDLQKVNAVDFTKSIVVIVFMGEKGSDQYSIEINDIRKTGSSVSIYANFKIPVEGQERHPVVTSPYYILEIEKNGDFLGTFTFLLKSQTANIDQVTVEISQ
jgi:hypothetical protein